MAVNNTHPDYQARAPQWSRCRDAKEGDDAVKASGETYLPKLDAQTDQEYQAYKTRALWYGATGRTIQGLGGAIFRKETIVEFPESLKDELDDVTMRGSSLNDFSKMVVEEVLAVGRCGALVDMPSMEEDAPPEDSRPYWVKYDAEQILNWREERIGGVMRLTLVVLSEITETFATDIFDTVAVQRYRVLRLVGNTCEVEVFEEREQDKPGGRAGEKETVLVSVQKFTLMRRGTPLPYIPFTFFNPTSITAHVEKPPLLDLVDVNFSHYRNSADLEHGRHFCGLPTPWAAGFSIAEPLKIGSGVAWMSENPQAKAEFLEFKGEGLGCLERALEEKERKMAALGARILEDPKKGQEAADTVRLRTSGQTSALQSIADTVSAGLTQLMRWHAYWAGVDDLDGISAKLNNDFADAEASPELLKSLVLLLQSGTISAETMYYNLQKSEVARPGIDWDEEKAMIDAGLADVIPPTESANEDDDQGGE